MRILIISPYHSGSHQAWAEGYQQYSRHEVLLLTLPGRFWKWRMHGSAVTLARLYRDHYAAAPPDVILGTDMLDLSTFLALTRDLTHYLREAWKHISEADKTHPDEAMAMFFSLMKLVFLDISLTIDTYIDSRERTIKSLQQEAIRELSTPVLPFREGMLLLPIIGQIDSQRARQLTEHLLESIRANRARVIVIDITGVATVDSRVANHLVQTVEAARLMGAEVVVSGISPEIALTMVTLGIDLGSVHTVGDLQNGRRSCRYRCPPRPPIGGSSPAPPPPPWPIPAAEAARRNPA
ncbi:MAG: DUF3524 domain-containing protein, partial [Chloroflexota bacterium]